MDRCKLPICPGKLDKEPCVTLGSKGASGVNIASQDRGDSISVHDGDIVHHRCCKDYCRPSNIKKAKQNTASDSTSTAAPSLRSEKRFSFKDHCLLCGQSAVYDDKSKKRSNIETYTVRTKDFQTTIQATCQKRNDDWANEVLGRIEYAQDLHAADTIYHQQCSVNFRTGKDKPKDIIPSKMIKRGRPANEVLNEAFLKVARYLEENDDEQTSVGDLIGKMQEYLPEHNGEDYTAYSFTYMKCKLEQHFGNRIIITEIAGKPNVVTFKTTAAAILHEFRENTQKGESMSEQGVIETAAKLLKNDIKAINLLDNYPECDDIENTEAAPGYRHTYRHNSSRSHTHTL